MHAKRLPRNSYEFGWGLGVMALLAALCAIGWSGWHLANSHAVAQRDAEDLEMCHRFLRRIEAARSEPVTATIEARQPEELAGEIEDAAAVGGISPAQLDRIDPQPSRRVDDTSYKEQATLVEMRGVTMRQLVLTLKSLIGKRPELRVSELRLVPPRLTAANADQPETWDAELTLTQAIFAPKTRTTE